MIPYLMAETIKLRRSLALLLAISAPAFVALLAFLIAWRNPKPEIYPFGMVMANGAGLWAMAMFPLSLTALSVLVAQTEHGPRTWDHLLTMPGARLKLFVAKMVVMVGVAALMSLMLWLSLGLAAAALPSVRAITGQWDGSDLAILLGKMLAAGLMMMAGQLWVALRFRSFVPPLIVGIVGTFVSIAASSAEEGVYFPWLMPLRMLAPEPDMVRLALQLGSIGGLFLTMLMIADLSRREA